jgi:hypothetical protein
MRHMRSTDGASVSKTTKVALNTAMHLPKNLCMIEPPRACMAISNDNDEGTCECWRGEACRIEFYDAGDGYDVSFDGLIFVAFIYLVFCVVLVGIVVRCHGCRTFRRLSGW